MDTDELLYTVEDHIATITLNRPERLNALSPEMSLGLLAALQDVVYNDDVRVVVVTGTGRAFCAGGNVGTMMARRAAEKDEGALGKVRSMDAPSRQIPVLMTKLRKPTIAMVNGVAAGWGCDFSMCCDMRIAGESARFTEAFVKRGLVPDGASSWFIPRIAGIDKACDVMFTGRIVGAREAFEMGLVTRVVPDEKLRDETYALASEIAGNAPLAVQLAKRMIYEQQGMGVDQAMQQVAVFLSLMRETEDHREGVASFMEKRKPEFKGR